MKICIKAWAWVGIEDRIGIGPGSNHNEGPKLGIGPGSMFRARDRIGIENLGIDPSLPRNMKIMLLFGNQQETCEFLIDIVA